MPRESVPNRETTDGKHSHTSLLLKCCWALSTTGCAPFHKNLLCSGAHCSGRRPVQRLPLAPDHTDSIEHKATGVPPNRPHDMVYHKLGGPPLLPKHSAALGSPLLSWQ